MRYLVFTVALVLALISLTRYLESTSAQIGVPINSITMEGVV